MNKPFETYHFSYGNQVSKLSDQNLIDCIKNAEGELESLRTIKAKSATIKGLKASLKTAIANLVQALDKTNNFTEGTTMSEAFKTVNYVYGTDITTMSTTSLIAAIKKAEAERGALEAVQADSKKVATLKDEITAAIAKMVEALDARA